ncbi:ADP-ribosylhydrolase ARH3 isoform X2 [Panthera uncia]|uniref:ADP-ribosylhydrolase ARH3 isoform X2 n=1 Tax=Panthera uncia TaxID=29064 RepID=UPI0020FF7CDF|nr:ADP-ribosylhydrolase ARH3 isoform X2 [Panthera uncia]
MELKAEARPKPVMPDAGAASPGRWAALWARRDAEAPGRWAALWGWREALLWGARRPYRKWRLLRADGGGGGGGGDDGGGLRGGWGGPLPLSLPRLPSRRAARGLRGLLLRGARYRHPDVSPASRPEPGAGPGLAGERADRWAGPGAEALYYTDDTAMARALVQSLLAKEAFDEVDMAHRFAQEYKKDPDRGYGAGVVTVFKKLLSPKCRDVFEPARAQFNGKGSYGNGGAMRVAGISLAYSSVQDVQKALAVHLALQGESSSEHFLQQLLGHMEELESDAQSVSDARELGMEERPYSSRLKKIGALLEQDSVTREEVVSELGNGIAAFESVPTAIYCFLRCMEPDPEIPSAFNSLQRTLIYSISLGGDTDTIATMAGAIAGAYYGMEQVPESWQQSCEGYEETDVLAQSLHRLFQKSL